MYTLIFVLLLWGLIFILLRGSRQHLINFPKYFRNGSMRVVPGKREDEFIIEILQSPEPDVELWVPCKTINGWQEVLIFVREEERRRKAATEKKRK